jgi:peptidoglycan/xylan/chitin deacetylase (PgdA/CDA1 family)
MRLQQLVTALQDGNLPRRPLVITFDDGYADNLLNAKPVLERYDVPATVFLATGYLGHNREFWWDELDRLLLQPGTLPETLRLSINGSAYEWRLDEAAHYSEDAHRRYCHWKAWEEAPSPRHFLYYSLWQLLRPLLEDERQKVLNELLVWASAKPETRPTHRTLSLEEGLTLARGKLIEVGSHTVTHSALAALPAVLQRDEIQRSKVHLEEILGHPVTSFAYPYGGPSDYTAETAAIVREAGFACACSTLAGVVGRTTDRFQLPRVQVNDWDGEEFARQLTLWFDS